MSFAKLIYSHARALDLFSLSLPLLLPEPSFLLVQLIPFADVDLDRGHYFIRLLPQTIVVNELAVRIDQVQGDCVIDL